jgi:hypothetical protein
MAVEHDSGPLRIARLAELTPAGSSHDESKVRRTPLEHEDAYELLDHEFTLVPDDSEDPPTPVVDLPGRRWLPPLPKWAARSRALLERWASRDTRSDADRPSDPDVFYDDTPTPVMESVECSVTELRSLRQELAWATRELYVREVQIEQITRARAPELSMLEGQIRGQAQRMAELEAALAASVSARADEDARWVAHAAELAGEVRRQAHRIAELEVALRATASTPKSDAVPRPTRKAAQVRAGAAKPRARAAGVKHAAKAPKKRAGAALSAAAPKRPRKTAGRPQRG